MHAQGLDMHTYIHTTEGVLGVATWSCVYLKRKAPRQPPSAVKGSERFPRSRRTIFRLGDWMGQREGIAPMG